MVDFVWDNLISGKSFNTPEKRAELEGEINRLTSLINDFVVKKNYKNFFREKFFQEFKFSGKRMQNKKKKEYLLSKNIININKISERVLIGTIILHPSLLTNVSDKFKLINFSYEEFNNIKELIVDLFNKKTIENLNIRATLLNSEYKKVVLEIIDKSILLHAPFLKNKSNINLISEGWNEYLVEYLKKKDNNILKKEASKLLTKLNEENYKRFKKYNLNAKKK